MSALCLAAACGGGSDNNDHLVDAPTVGTHQCNDGIDNDGDGKIDFPDDPGCTSPTDDTEDSLPAPQCSDGRDNDGDGKVDYPDDPGCITPQQDDETDDCPSGPNCPACADGKDNDGNGKIDYPMDPGCSSASDTTEFTENPLACGANVMIKQLPANGMDTGTSPATASGLISTTCGGAGPEVVYEIHVAQPQVMVATTVGAGTSEDTVLYVRDSTCMTELACNDDDTTAGTGASTLTVSLQTGTYYLVVDAATSTSSGAYALSVKFYVGEGVACSSNDMCGPGLVCRVPMGGSAKVCSKHVCSDGVDDDGDGKKDFPDDPGCTSADDDDETDDCPTGPNCPQCADGKDNDGDGKTDYPADTSCASASSTSESCTTHEGVTDLTMPVTVGDTSAAGVVMDSTLACAFEPGPDLAFGLKLPATTSLNIDIAAIDDFNFFGSAELLGATCGGTAIECEEFADDGLSQTNLAAGQYFLMVQSGDPTLDVGKFQITVSGVIKHGESCESPLAQSGALTCGDGYGCGGTVGSRTCVVAECSDGIDNNHDGKIDYPEDPGCSSPNDAVEDTVCPGANCPVCSDGMDNDTDTLTDYPADWGCSSAAGTTEKFCMPDMDVASQALITMPTTTGTTIGMHDDLTPTCTSNSMAPDIVFGLSLPVPVAALTLDTKGSLNMGSTTAAFDTVLYVKDAACTTGVEYACNDGTDVSTINMTNVKPGNYAVVVDGYSTHTGTVKLNVTGTVVDGTKCESTLFTNNVLKCTGASTCKGTAGSKTCKP